MHRSSFARPLIALAVVAATTAYAIAQVIGQEHDIRIAHHFIYAAAQQNIDTHSFPMRTVKITVDDIAIGQRLSWRQQHGIVKIPSTARRDSFRASK